jgi:hypothetical protein
MSWHIITDKELNDIIQAAGDEVRGAFGKGDPEKAEKRLQFLEGKILAREIPGNALGFYVLDHNHDPKCLRFSGEKTDD